MKVTRVTEQKQGETKMTETIAKLTMDAIENAAWTIHDNWTDGNVPESRDDSQCLYKSAVATIDGHEYAITYSDEMGLEWMVDGINDRWYGDLDKDEVIEAVEEQAGCFQSTDDLYDRWELTIN